MPEAERNCRKFREGPRQRAHNGRSCPRLLLLLLTLLPPITISAFCFDTPYSTMADALKAEGNKAFSAKDYSTAV